MLGLHKEQMPSTKFSPKLYHLIRRLQASGSSNSLLIDIYEQKIYSKEGMSNPIYTGSSSAGRSKLQGISSMENICNCNSILEFTYDMKTVRSRSRGSG